MGRKIKFIGQKKLILHLDENVRQAATKYMDNHNCPIATAIKQQVGNFKEVSVAGSWVTIDNVIYCDHAGTLPGGDVIGAFQERKPIDLDYLDIVLYREDR